MSLTLKILSFDGQPFAGSEDVVINEQGGSIGRADTNTLALNDEYKIISRRHAILEFDNGQYKLTDCSLGGTFIDNAVEPLNNSSVHLIDGMQIKIGEYIIACSISNEASPFLSPNPDNPFADQQVQQQADESQLSNDVESELISPFATDSGGQDFASDLLGSVEPPSDGGLLNSLENNDLLNSSGPNFTEASDLEQNDLLNNLGPDYNPASDLDHNDLFNNSGSDFSAASDLYPNDLLNAASNSTIEPDQSLMSENISSLNDSFEPAKPIENNSILDNSESEIPEDFNFEDLFNMEENGAKSSIPEKKLETNESIPAVNQSSVLNQDIPEELNSDPGLLVPEQISEGDIPSTDEVNSAIKNDAASDNVITNNVITDNLITDSVTPNNVVTDNVISNNVVTNTQPLVNNDELIQAFLRGLQMGPEDIKFTNPVEKMERIGKMLRQFAESTVAVLRSRAEFKSMFRVNVTTIQRIDNNPLKFAVTTDDAIKHLINDEQVGFKESVESIDEGFDDLLNHQLAMQAGIQASINDILMQFNPAVIEKQYEEGIVLQKKSKCWDKYNLIHKRLSETAVEEFFGDAFSEAYEQQMKQLKK